MSAKELLGDADYPIPVGAMTFWAGLNPPQGWLLCDGSSKLINDYPDLYRVLGNQFGAASVGYFKLPDTLGSATASDGKIPEFVSANTGSFENGVAGSANLTFTMATANLPSLPALSDTGGAYGITQSGSTWTSLVNNGRSVADNDTTGGSCSGVGTDKTYVPYNTPVLGAFITPTSTPANVSRLTPATPYNGVISLDGEVPRRYEMPIIIKASQVY